MKSVKNEFPNPVLAEGRDDYISSCRFATFFDADKVIVTDENIEIPINYILECKGLEELVGEGRAKVVISIRSSAASYSELESFENNSTSLQLHVPKFDVVKRIELKGAVIATEAIHNFSCPGEFNELYFGSATFDIRKGDILATEDSRTIYVDDSELEKPISSVFNITRRDNEDDEIEPDFQDEKINIFLSPELHRLYNEFIHFNNGSLRRYAASIIVYPVLVEAITVICGCEQDLSGDSEYYKSRRWYRAIEKKAEKYNFNFEDENMAKTSLANKLLGEICSDAMKSFKDTLDTEANSGETEYMGGID